MDNIKEDYHKARSAFEKRTDDHILKVEVNIETLLNEKEFRDYEKKSLDIRAKSHDKSKYYRDEIDGFIWLNWLEDNNIKHIPNHKAYLISESIRLHHKRNAHHPEYHKKISHMMRYDIAEMVADLAAMSQEKKNDITGWVKNNTIKKYRWNEFQRYCIWDFVNVFKELN